MKNNGHTSAASQQKRKGETLKASAGLFDLLDPPRIPSSPCHITDYSHHSMCVCVVSVRPTDRPEWTTTTTLSDREREREIVALWNNNNKVFFVFSIPSSLATTSTHSPPSEFNYPVMSVGGYRIRAGRFTQHETHRHKSVVTAPYPIDDRTTHCLLASILVPFSNSMHF